MIKDVMAQVLTVLCKSALPGHCFALDSCC